MIIRRYITEDAKAPQGPGPAQPKPIGGPQLGRAPQLAGPRHIIDADSAILIGNVLPPRPEGAKKAFDHAVESILRCVNNCTTDEELAYYKKALKSVVSEITKRI